MSDKNNEEKNNKRNKNKKKDNKDHKLLKIILSIILVILLLLYVIICTYIIYNRKQQKILSEKKSNLKSIFIGTDKEIEYGTEVKIDDLEKELFNFAMLQSIDSYKLEINNEEQFAGQTYKFMKINDNKIKSIIHEVDNNKKVLIVNIDNSSFLNFFKNFSIKYEPQSIDIEREYNYKVVDTQKPIIEGVENKEIFKGEDIDLKAGITAKDPVDGDLEFTVNGNVKKEEVGEYQIKVTATDKNSNESTAEFKVIVKEKPIINNTKITTNTSTNKKSSNSSNTSKATTSSNAKKDTNSTSTSVATYTVMSSMEKEMFNLTNKYRTSAGLKALTWDSKIASIARQRSLATAQLGAEYYGWGHYATKYGYIGTHLKNSGVSFSDVNEIIAWNYSTNAAVKWLYNSSLHHAAMMGDYDITGCGVCKGPDGEYIYFQVFVKK